MPARTRDNQDWQPVIYFRRTDYTLQLILYGLRVLASGMLFYPLAGTDLVPEFTWQPPRWWADEARRGWKHLDAARQLGSGLPE